MVGMVQIRATRPLGWQTAVCSEPGLIGRTSRGGPTRLSDSGALGRSCAMRALENAWGD